MTNWSAIEVAMRQNERRRMLRRSRRCHWCRRPLGQREATIDHEVPLARGGADEPSNWVCACVRCNNAKGDLMPDEFRLAVRRGDIELKRR